MERKVSVVINTVDRCASLIRAIDSLRYQSYPDFEVIVVNGPSTDDTAPYLKTIQGEIKFLSCAERNLSKSRNIGIAAAAGDIVAFIDDDGIAERDWLRDIVAGYEDGEVGAVGGFTYDYTGMAFQETRIVSNRLGRSISVKEDPILYAFPFSESFPGLMGVNSSFRRDVLLRIGGFDEEYEYFLDETDLCARVNDAGYVVRTVEGGYVHHKYLPSNLRDENRMVLNYYPSLKNICYYGVKVGAAHWPISAVIANVEEIIREARKSFQWQNANNKLDQRYLTKFELDAYRAVEDGIARGQRAPRQLISAETLKRFRTPFKPFPRCVPSGRPLTLCFLSRMYPPGPMAGIARLVHVLARTLARMGHIVHVLTESKDGRSRVDYEDRVWVHRIAPSNAHGKPIPNGLVVPQAIWDYSASMLAELERLAARTPVDLVQAPAWDVEGIAIEAGGQFRVVHSLHTPLPIVLEGHPDWLRDPKHVRLHIEPLLAAERHLVEHGSAFYANSKAILDSMETSLGVKFGGGEIAIVPHGVDDLAPAVRPVAPQRDSLEVLFVGRLEKRKGIDVLLQVVPDLLMRYPHLRLKVVGNATIPGDDGQPYADAFLHKHAGQPFLDRIDFPGEVPDEELQHHYAHCDIFVAPSRFESFGLIYLEAMMYAKPVIGCRAGGIPEVIEDGATGLLAEPGDPETLKAALIRLIEDGDLRHRLGVAARQSFEKNFTAKRMAERSLAFYERVIAQETRHFAKARPA